MTPPQPGRRSVLMLIGIQFPEACVVNSEVVRDLVAHHVLYEVAYFLRRAALQFNGMLEDADLVGQYQLIVARASCLGDAFIESQKVSWVLLAGPCQHRAAGPILDHDIDVVKLVADF